MMDHLDLRQQIDAVNLGHVPWVCAILNYKGALHTSSQHPPAEWKLAEYEVWYRNPRQVIRSILATVEFDGHVDYSAYQEFEGEARQYSNMMLGDWAWRQSVRLDFHYLTFTSDVQTSGYHCSRFFNPWVHVRPNYPWIRQDNGFSRDRPKRLLPPLPLDWQRPKPHPTRAQECTRVDWVPPNPKRCVNLPNLHSS